jgi:hypothetical protein
MVWFQTENFQELSPSELRLRWDKTNLTVDESAKVRISVWGYREDTVTPKLEYIDMLLDGVVNNGDTKLYHSDYLNRDNGPSHRQYTFGFIQINLTTYDPKVGMSP